jgi:hypothetical protein
MKKLILPLLLVIVLTFTGCSNYIEFGAIEQSNSHEFSSSYIKLSGTKIHTLKVKDGETINIEADIVTKKGKLDVYIYKNKDKNEYEGNNVKTGTFTVNLTEPGNYKIKVIAKNHKGSYKFKW